MSTVSLLIHTSVPRWTVNVCRACRPAVDEIVVAVDDRVPEDELGALEDLVDRLWRYEYADPPERVIAWLASQSTGDWLLRLDHDEVPSCALLDDLHRLIADDQLTHYWLLRRWPYADVETYLDEPPWSPDRQLRLLRHDPRFVRFPGVLHVPTAAEGPGAWIDGVIYHFDLLVNDESVRRAKAKRWERAIPGMRLAGRSLNEALYLPEDRAGLALKPVPLADVVVLRSIVEDSGNERRLPRRTVPVALRDEIDALWPARTFPDDAYRATVQLTAPIEPIVVGERKLVEARVRNGGTEAWPWGPEGLPPIRLSYHWLAPSGDVVVLNGERTAFPHDVPPETELTMPLTVEAPEAPGDYLLEVLIVHEHQRWFGDGLRVPVRVTAARKIAILARADPLDTLVELAFTRPEHEAVVVPAREYLIGERRSRLRMLAQLVRRGTRLLRDVRREGGSEVALVLREADELVVVGPPVDRVDRAVEAMARMARAAGHRP